MMKNLPKDYKDVFNKILNMRGFLGVIDESNVGKNDAVYGTLGLVFENDDVVDKQEYFDLSQEFYKCGESRGLSDPCLIYPITKDVLCEEDSFVDKETLTKDLEEVMWM